MTPHLQKPLDWKLGKGVVAWIDQNCLPTVTLPPEAHRIVIDGKPAYHVTLLRRREIEPAQEAMSIVWPNVVQQPLLIPQPRIISGIQTAGDASDGDKVWFLLIDNGPEFDAALQKLLVLLHESFSQAGWPNTLIQPETKRWHVTIANTRGGDPLLSSSGGEPSTNQKESD